MHGDPVYRGDPAAEKYPDAQNIPPIWRTQIINWSFFGLNTFNGYFRITTLHYWKPTSMPMGVERLKDPGSGGNRKLAAPAGAVTRKRSRSDSGERRPHLFRYRKALGFVSTATAFECRHTLCDAFTVDAHTGVWALISMRATA
jgi:hypothetical protein